MFHQPADQLQNSGKQRGTFFLSLSFLCEKLLTWFTLIWVIPASYAHSSHAITPVLKAWRKHKMHILIAYSLHYI